jgi:hypothetical protein
VGGSLVIGGSKDVALWMSNNMTGE